MGMRHIVALFLQRKMQVVFMKNFLKHTGWVVLSTLCFFIVFFFVQWLTFEILDLLLIQNHLLLFALSGLVGLIFPKWYGLIGASVLVMLLSLLMLLEDNLTILLYSSSALIVLGSATGVFLRKKIHFAWITTLAIGGLVLWNAYKTYSTITTVTVPAEKKTDATRFNVFCDDFVALDGSKLHLSRDTVYLVNFTFYTCKPCREKHPSLKLLEKEFAHLPFKLVTIHSVDSMDVFRKHYSDYANCYHNPNVKRNQQLGIDSYPYEIIFNKKGNEIRRFSGFSPDAEEDYISKTRMLIKKLLDEK